MAGYLWGESSTDFADKEFLYLVFLQTGFCKTFTLFFLSWCYVCILTLVIQVLYFFSYFGNAVFMVFFVQCFHFNELFIFVVTQLLIIAFLFTTVKLFHYNVDNCDKNPVWYVVVVWRFHNLCLDVDGFKIYYSLLH